MNALALRPRPLATALTLLAAITVGVLALSLARNDGHLVYALDDAYIHMAMAKNLVTHGVWGVTPNGFTSSSSSPLWVLLLAASYRLFGVNHFVPLALNAIFAVTLLVAADRGLRRLDVSPAARTVGLVALVLLTPVVPVALCGLEHLLHATAAILFASALVAVINPPTVGSSARRGALVLAAMLLVAARYEGLFLVGAGALVLGARRRIADATFVIAAGFVPVVAYGLYSLRHGWYFLPTSIVLKASVPHSGLGGALATLAANFGISAVLFPHLLVAVLAGGGALLVARRRGGVLHAAWSTMIVVVLIASLLHMLMARGGGFYRYEAYLLAIWSVALTAAWPHLRSAVRAMPALRPKHAAVGLVVALVAAAPCITRSAQAHVRTPVAAGEIYAQHTQMGRFVQQYFAGRRIALNDIGVVDYLADIDLFDLYGLASREVVDAERGPGYDTAGIDAFTAAHHTEIAIAYEKWFDTVGGLPRSWRRMGTWTIATRVTVGDKKLSFFAVDPRVAPELARALRAFSSALPPSVKQDLDAVADHEPMAESHRSR